ncbi:MAG: hypothetical protein CR967_03620 [Proteobacteria bacterium]|nr:MAG: hypothetical protein CR967_03620 [Pseudomonadota bacterium]
MPIISFESGGCSYCKECANVCQNGVLDLKNQNQIKALFTIDTTKCLSWKGVVCFACKDVCDMGAIEFFGMFRPQVLNTCICCGFCVRPCPSDAIMIKEKL